MKDAISISAPAAITRAPFLGPSPRHACGGTALSPRRAERAFSRMK
jgi:hypothetical protein